jgi:hypothetical protein
VSAESFDSHVAHRMAIGAQEYGDRSYDLPLETLLGEILDECADIGAWSRIAGDVLTRSDDLAPADRAAIARVLRVATQDAERAWRRLHAAATMPTTVDAAPASVNHDPGDIELVTQISVVIAVCEQLWRTQNANGLTTRTTRKPPADVLRSLHRWQQSLASVETSATLHEVVADGTAG